MITHTLTFTADGEFDLRPVVICHNDPVDVDRDCKYATGGAWNDCVDVAYAAPEELEYRRQHGHRYACGGWDFQGDHLHPDDGCGVIWAMPDGAEGIAIEGELTSDAPWFRVRWEEGCPILVPVDEVTP